jgi:hypothetical protein
MDWDECYRKGETRWIKASWYQKRLTVLLPYGEPLNDARTPLADFFRILLDGQASSLLSGHGEE